MDSFIYFFILECLLIVLVVFLTLWHGNKPKKLVPTYEITEIKN